MTSDDLFSAAGEPPVLDPAPDFRRCFLTELGTGPTTASRTRKKYGIPGTPRIGHVVNALFCAGIIECIGCAPAVTPESQRHLERVWQLVERPKGTRQ